MEVDRGAVTVVVVLPGPVMVLIVIKSTIPAQETRVGYCFMLDMGEVAVTRGSPILLLPQKPYAEEIGTNPLDVGTVVVEVIVVRIEEVTSVLTVKVGDSVVAIITVEVVER